MAGYYQTKPGGFGFGDLEKACEEFQESWFYGFEQLQEAGGTAGRSMSTMNDLG
ncbi:hypothetical protein ACIP2X_07520 [Streptomyces sp. NPDC089424]|uniref:hypothetical protein n=1 Tax=Streptomyces sp. NPDC089424 TaxID=3365917 RepID=UPI0037F29C76